MTSGSDHTPIKLGLMNQFPDFSTPGFDINIYNERFQRANVIISAKSKQIGFSDHWGGLSVKCSFNGYEYYESKNEFYAVDDSSYLVFNEGKYYSSFIDSKSDVDSFTVNFSPQLENIVFQSLGCPLSQMLSDPFGSLAPKFRFNEELTAHNPEVSTWIFRLRELTSQWNENQESIKESLFLLLEQMVHREIRTRNGDRMNALKSSTKKELLRRLNGAKDYILSNYSNGLTLEEVADVSCLNPYYFLRQFKNLFGTTPHQYLQQKRIREAALLLRQGDESISTICNRVGFFDPGSFGKLFKRFYDQSPGQFRSFYRKNKLRHMKHEGRR